MKKSFQTFWRGSASGTSAGVAESLLVMSLTPLSGLYSLAQRMRELMYRYGIFKTVRLPRPVVSIGNLTVGGTGKTPVAAYISRFLLAQGYRVAVLSRGYGGSLEGSTCVVSDGSTIMLGAAECGDEPYLLAATVPGLMVVIGTDRYAAGQLAMQQFSPDIFLLDDGFQHLRLHRDLNILLMDFSRPLGNGWTLPGGLLRESSAAARRADMIIFTRAAEGSQITYNTHGIPVCISSHTMVDLLPLGGTGAIPFSACRGHALVAFAGIADPESFFDGLRKMGLNPVQTFIFPDHADYNQERCNSLAEAMRTNNADFFVTTEKDGVKLGGFSKEYADRTLLVRLDLEIDTPDELKSMLTDLLAKRSV